VSFETRLNGPPKESVEEREKRYSLFTDPESVSAESEGSNPRMFGRTCILSPLPIITQMQRELSGHESVGLGFARGYALATHFSSGGQYRIDIHRISSSDRIRLHYDFNVAGEDIEYVTDDFSDDEHSDWLVCTDEEADARASEYIRESLWAFNTSFLAGQTSLPEEVFSALQPQCESANDAVRRLIESPCGLNSFVEAAIGADGRGNFVASYDHEEHEVQIGTHTFYIYRLN